jgi:hypothetical protein
LFHPVLLVFLGCAVLVERAMGLRDMELRELADELEPDEREAFLDALDSGDLPRIEEETRLLMGRLARPAFEAYVQARADEIDGRDQPPRCPTCGSPMKVWRTSERTLQTSIGTIRFARREYRCCEKGLVRPADEALGIARGARQSPHLDDIESAFGGELGSFELAAEMLKFVVRRRPASTTVNEATIRAGEAARAEEARQVAVARAAPRRVSLLPDAARKDDTLIIEIDGGMVRTDDGWREAKVRGDLPGPRLHHQAR